MRSMKWEEVYKLWELSSLYLPDSLSAPVEAETVAVRYDREGYIYGYDWLRNDIAQRRKQRIADDPVGFLLFSEPTNKGTIHTAQMLTEAEDEQERAAIWIAATAFELMEHHREHVSPYARQLHEAAAAFLRERFYLWHHAMRGLVPEIMIPYLVLDSIQCDRPEAVMGLIQTNAIMLKGCYTLLRYSSIDETDDIAARHSLRLDA